MLVRRTTVIDGGDVDETDGPNFIAIIAVLIVAVIMMRGGSIDPSDPDKPNKPERGDLSALALELQEETEGTDSEVIRKYGAFYDIAADELSDIDVPLSQVRNEIAMAKDILKLPSVSGLRTILARELSPFEDSNPDRTEYSAALRKVADACREVGDE